MQSSAIQSYNFNPLNAYKEIPLTVPINHHHQQLRPKTKKYQTIDPNEPLKPKNDKNQKKGKYV